VNNLEEEQRQIETYNKCYGAKNESNHNAKHETQIFHLRRYSHPPLLVGFPRGPLNLARSTVDQNENSPLLAIPVKHALRQDARAVNWDCG